MHKNKDFEPKSIIKTEGYKNDSFLIYLEAMINRDVNLLLEVIDLCSDFYEAYLLLADISTTYIKIAYPLSICYYMRLKISKDIDPSAEIIEILNNFIDHRNKQDTIISDSEDKIMKTYEKIILNDLNLVAAFYYCMGSTEKAEIIFSEILDFNLDQKNQYNNISFFDFYSIILYNKSDSSLLYLAENLNNFYTDSFEALVTNGVCHVSKGNYELSKDLFKKALKKSKDCSKLTVLDLHCLIGHNYIRLNNYEEADKSFQEALMLGFDNFRILYTVAQGYFSMQKHEISLWYCKKALEKKDDGSIWKLLGRVFISIEKYVEAEDCLKRAEELNEMDSILYLADLYKKIGSAEKALDQYKKYLTVGANNKDVVIKYLIDYYEEQGDVEASRYYKNLAF